MGGTLLRSDDGSNWIAEGTLTLKALFGCVADEERLWLTGVEGVILRSPIALPRDPVVILKYSRFADPEQTQWQSLFLFGGETDQRFTLDRRESPGEGNWIPGPQLEIFESGGTLLYLEGVGLSNAPPEEYYGTVLLEEGP